MVCLVNFNCLNSSLIYTLMLCLCSLLVCFMNYIRSLVWIMLNEMIVCPTDISWLYVYDPTFFFVWLWFLSIYLSLSYKMFIIWLYFHLLFPLFVFFYFAGTIDVFISQTGSILLSGNIWFILVYWDFVVVAHPSNRLMNWTDDNWCWSFIDSQQLDCF